MRIGDSSEMAGVFRQSVQAIEERKLPGFNNFLRSNKKAMETFIEKFDEIESIIKDQDKVLFEKSIKAFKAVCWRINEVIAERHRLAHKDPEEWELRYIRFMKIKFIRFSTDSGEFFLVPKQPRIKPKAKHWFTVDEMIDILGCPATCAAIKTFGALPVRPEANQEGPPPGEKYMFVDLTGSEMEVKYTWHPSAWRKRL